MKQGTKLSEDELIHQIGLKSRAGADALYTMYGGSLYGVILKIVNNQEMAEDILQEAFLKVWNNFEHYSPEKGRLYTWLVSITRNMAIDAMRSKRHKEECITDPIELYQGWVEESNYIVYNPDTISVKSMIGKLRTDYRLILELVYFKGYTFAEAAKILSIPEGTAKTRCRSAIILLRNIYREKPSKPLLRLVS